MAITKWDQLTDPATFREQLDTLWPGPFLGRGREGSFVPVVDVFDNKDAIVLKAELAGMRPEDITIEVSDDVLTIRGERRQEDKADEKGYTHVERRYGAFERNIALPAGAKADDITATCEDGVLTVRVPKGEDKKPERIEVKAAPASKAKGKAA